MADRIPLQALAEIVQQSGFALCGVTDAAPLEAYARHSAWLAAGLHADMRFLEDARRSTPGQVFPQARSIVVLAARYPARAPWARPAGLTGIVSAHAWGQDYHRVLRQRAELVARELQRLSGRPFEYQVAVDATPLMEKPLAARANLGWQGRNTLMNHTHHGSCFFLTEILTPLEIEAAASEHPDRCGTCQRCRQACPTACIRPDCTLDARHCLAYQTIENKGAIPREIRPLVGHHLFGCDACQQVCPWNRKVDDAVVLPEFLPASDSAVFPDLREVVRLSEADFRRRYAGSGLLRARRRGLLRNAAVVLGNYHSVDALDPLATLLQCEADPLIRAHAAWGLGQTPSPRAREILSAALKNDPHESVLEEIRLALESHDSL